uniref:CARD domain-containing protein n=2 Tax=Plectus sambesii TaxID=2011161 RepID=A0A914XCK1_9BILA
MNEKHRNALQASQYDICQELDAEDVLPYLNTKGIVQDGQIEELMVIARKEMRNMRLIHIVKGAGPLAFQEFINALQICNKEFLASKILARLSSSSTQQLTLPEKNITVSNSARETSDLETPASGFTSGIQSRDLFGGTQNNQVAHRDIVIYNFNGTIGQTQDPSTSSTSSFPTRTKDWQKKLET